MILVGALAVIVAGIVALCVMFPVTILAVIGAWAAVMAAGAFAGWWKRVPCWWCDR